MITELAPAPAAPAPAVRYELIRPGMCGHNSLFAGQIGDWTWDAVSAACGIDVLTAVDPAGAPTYLSFYYYRLRGSRRFHPRTPAFGDRLTVASKVFGFGSESVLTLHRITPTGSGAPAEIDPDEFYRFADDGALYVENFNRWVGRGGRLGNEALVRSSPIGFQHRHLPNLPEVYSPRGVCRQARIGESFVDHAARGDRELGAPVRVEYEVDPSRDLNGAGLLYFASYFSIVDWALLRLWRRLGRDDRSYLDRIVVDQRLCFLGNADAGSVLAISLRRWPGAPGTEVVDVILRERGTGRLLAVCTLDVLTEESG